MLYLLTSNYKYKYIYIYIYEFFPQKLFFNLLTTSILYINKATPILLSIK